jgi:hypothetical protein
VKEVDEVVFGKGSGDETFVDTCKIALDLDFDGVES